MSAEKERVVLPKFVAKRELGERVRVQLVFPKVGKTQAHFKDECDINKIVPKALKNGTFRELLAEKGGSYGKFDEVPDYLDAMNIVAKANEQFAALPAKARERFNNDPVKFLEFTHEKGNDAEMIKLGLATKRPIELKEASSSPSKGKNPPEKAGAPRGRPAPPAGDADDA